MYFGHSSIKAVWFKQTLLPGLDVLSPGLWQPLPNGICRIQICICTSVPTTSHQGFSFGFLVLPDFTCQSLPFLTATLTFPFCSPVHISLVWDKSMLRSFSWGRLQWQWLTSPALLHGLTPSVQTPGRMDCSHEGLFQRNPHPGKKKGFPRWLKKIKTTPQPGISFRDQSCGLKPLL